MDLCMPPLLTLCWRDVVPHCNDVNVRVGRRHIILAEMSRLRRRENWLSVCCHLQGANAPIDHTWGPFFLYSLDKILLLRIMPNYFSQLEFPVVSGQHTISKYRSLVHDLIYWYLFHVEPNLSLFHFHLTWKTVSISKCNLPGLVFYIWWNLQGQGV
jgi:hypothetical protein